MSIRNIHKPLVIYKDGRCHIGKIIRYAETKSRIVRFEISRPSSRKSSDVLWEGHISQNEVGTCGPDHAALRCSKRHGQHYQCNQCGCKRSHEASRALRNWIFSKRPTHSAAD